VTMCIAFWVLDQHPAFWLILALNRDEFHARPTRPFHFWDDDEHKDILGGRDLRSGGTWMGISRTARLAFLTNVREANWNDRPEKISRGDLPTRFLISKKSSMEFAEEIAGEAEQYNGFNMVVADFAQQAMVFVSNRHGDTTSSDSFLVSLYGCAKSIIMIWFSNYLIHVRKLGQNILLHSLVRHS
jgi:uncharacterized protein with NRDE domain